MSSLAGQTFAGYEVIEKLGQGGMGAVYKARQPVLNRFVALKVMSSDLAGDPDFVARFKREANAAASLNHENIVQVFSAGEFEGGHFIAMEFVEGTTLRHHIESQGKLDPREAIAVTILVAQALQYAWNRARIIHRDIKPENIFLSHAGEVKVGDLGLAKTVGGSTTSLTQTGTMMGSPHYISPEQARGLSDIDFHTDIYSLGCTLYHMLTGRPPYTGTDPLVVINKHVNEPPPAIFKVWPTCPIPLALLVGKMLAKQRHERPASYEDLIEQLREVREKLKPATAVAPVSTSEPTQVLPTPTPAPKPVVARTSTPSSTPAAKRRSVISDWRFVIGGAAAVALIAGAVWWFAGRAGEGAGGTKVLNLGGGVKMELVAIPPGEFMFGNNPPHKAAIREQFWLGRTEVTVGQWKQFVAATGYQTSAEKKGYAHWCPQGPGKGTVGAGSKGTHWRTLNVGFPLQDNHPVACISWDDAVAFCEWLTERERKAGHLRAGHVLRLPTEAEWEYACRAGTTTKFWWGDDVNDGEGRVNWGGTEDGFEFMSPVDHFSERGRNRFGLADMLGNVAELCLDCFDAGLVNEQPSGGIPLRAGRGGSFAPGRHDCFTRSKNLRSDFPAGVDGFRVCLGPDMAGSAGSAAPVTRPASPVTVANDAFVKEVAVLPAEQQVARVVAKLKELNPGFDGKEKHKIQENDVTDLEISAINVTNISPVNALRKLRRFVCVASTDGRRRSKLSDLTPLQGLSLTELRVPGCDVSDLSVVRGMPLDHLGILHTRINDLSPLQGAPLTVLNCDETMAMMPGNLAVLRNIKTLKTINVSTQRFWRQVETEKLSGRQDDAFVKEVAALSAEQQVARVVAELKKLNPAYDGKEEHAIVNGQVTGFVVRSDTLVDVSPVRALVHLRRLTCSGIGLPGGRCNRNKVTDLTPLRNLPLMNLDFAFSEVADLSPLAGMRLDRLGFQGSRVRDISPLRGMPLRVLRLEGTPVTDFSPVVQCPIKEMFCSAETDRTSLLAIKTLERINGVPVVEFWKKVEAGEAPKP